MLHTQTVDAQTLALIKSLMADPKLADFLLVGGTALALMIGHRKSVDIDLFSNKPFDVAGLVKTLERDYAPKRLATSGMSATCIIKNVKTDIIVHEYPLLKPPDEIEGIRLISLEDIAAMKLHAIVNSFGERPKDFVDVYFLLERMPLNKMYDAYEAKYPNVSRSVAKIGLMNHGRIQQAADVVLINQEFEPEKISERLFRAMEDPRRTFKLPEQQNMQQTKEDKVIKKSKGQRPRF